MKRVISLFTALVIALASINFTVVFAQEQPLSGNAQTGKYTWVFGSPDEAGTTGTYNYVDEYGEIRVGIGEGDSITAADGIKWSNPSCKEPPTSAADSGRYIIVKPTFTGTMSISIAFSGAGSSAKCRLWYNDFGDVEFDDIDTGLLIKGYGEMGGQIGNDITDDSKKTLSFPVTAGHAYSIHTYNRSSKITSLYYESEDIAGKTETPVINMPVTSDDTSVSGTCAEDAEVMVRINGGEAQYAEVTGTEWILEGLELNEGDVIYVTAKAGDYNESSAAETTVIGISDVFALTIDNPDNGQIVSDQPDNSRIAKGSEVTLTVIPDDGYKLKSFMVNGEAADLEDNTYIFIITDDITVSAEFEEKVYYGIMLPQDIAHGTVSVTGGADNGKAMGGDTVTLSAEADEGYRLKSLAYSYGEEEPVDIKYTREFVMPESEVNIAAVFEETKVISEVDTSFSENDRLTLNVDGEPFFYNGIQLRADKVADSWEYTDEQIEGMFSQSAADGFTVVNTQIRWMDIQPDTEIAAAEIQAVPDGTYVRFTLPERESAYTAAKIKLKAENVVATSNPRLYGVTDNYIQGEELTDENSVDLGTLPSWNTITKNGSYDFDVSGFINDSYGTVGFVITGCDDADFTPSLVLSRDDAYDWSYVDRMIDNAAKYGLKLEILWFAIDTCQQTADSRVPWYVINNYQKTLREDKTPIRQGENGGYTYLMCKNDKALRAKEQEVLEALFNHIAEYDNANGYRHTVVGCQLTNEPATARTHNGDDHYNERCHCDVCEAKYNSFMEAGKSKQDYFDDTMYYYQNSLGEAVKLSDYSVWTRVNNYGGVDANLVEYNEKMRENGGTYIDFIGYDPYKQDTATMFNFGNTSTKMTKISVNYSQGKNLPMIMENGGSYSNSAALALAALAGGSFYNVYEFGGPDNLGLYDRDAGAQSGFKAHGSYIDEVRSTNEMLNKIAPILASYKADGAGGKKLMFFNALSDNSETTKKTVRAVPVIYNTENNGVGIAAEISDKEFAFESSKAAEFVLTGAKEYGVVSVETGAYENGVWTKTADKQYSENGEDIIIAADDYDCFKVVFADSIPEKYAPSYDYDQQTGTYTYDFGKFADSLSLSEPAQIGNLTVYGAGGDYINPSSAVYKDANGNETCDGGIWWNGKGDTGNRYMTYTPEKDGTLTLRLRRTYNAGSTAKSWLRYGTQKPAGNYDGASEELNSTEYQTMTVELTAGKTYFFWPVSSGVNISSVIFESEPVTYDNALIYNESNYTVTSQLAGDLIIARYNSDNSLKDTEIKRVSENETVRINEVGKYKIMLWNSVSGMEPLAETLEFTVEETENENILSRKTVYAFGDSIVYGHNAQSKSFMRLIADETGLNLGSDLSNDSHDNQPRKEYMYAVNGATVIKSSNDILTQVKGASSVAPDAVIFDGYTNDAYIDGILNNIGEIQGNSASEFDSSTFCGAFEEIIYTMRQKWGEDTPIIYVTIHKSYGNGDEKSALKNKAVEICNEWGVAVADIFSDSAMDTRKDNKTEDEWNAYMKKYIIGGSGTHPNETACREFYIPLIKPALEDAVR